MKDPATHSGPRVKACLILAMLSAFLGSPLKASSPLFKNNETVTLLLPRKGALYDLNAVRRLHLVFSTTILSEGEKGLVVGGFEDWQTQGFPAMARCKSYKPKPAKRFPGHIKMDVACYDYNILLLVQGTDVEAAKALFRQVLLKGKPDSPAAQAYSQEAFAKIGNKIFTGPLAGYPEAARAAFVLSFRTLDKARSLVQTEYKDTVYLLADLGLHHEVYNTVQLGRSARVARIFNDRLLRSLRGAGKQTKTMEGLGGFAFKIRIRYRNFVTDNESGTDQLEVFTPIEALRQFIDDDISSQSLIEASTVRLNDSRIEVDLSVD